MKTKNKCNICFIKKRKKGKIIFAKPRKCEHIFCFTCLEKWSQLCNECPVCRKQFRSIINANNHDEFLKKRIKRKKYKGPDYIKRGSLMDHESNYLNYMEMSENERFIFEKQLMEEQKIMLQYYQHLHREQM